MLPPLHAYKHVRPPIAEAVVVLCLVACGITTVAAVLRSARVRPWHSILLWAAAAAGLGASWALLLAPDPDCVACEIGYHYGTSEWSDVTCVAVAVSLQAAWVVYAGLVNLALKLTPRKKYD